MNNCPVCQNEPANIHSIFGVLPGNKCRDKRAKNSLPDIQVEFTSENIKSQRKEYAKSIVQPYRSGQLSKEYLEVHGTKNIKPTQEEVKKAKYVWGEDFSPNLNLKKTK